MQFHMLLTTLLIILKRRSIIDVGWIIFFTNHFKHTIIIPIMLRLHRPSRGVLLVFFRVFVSHLLPIVLIVIVVEVTLGSGHFHWLFAISIVLGESFKSLLHLFMFLLIFTFHSIPFSILVFVHVSKIHLAFYDLIGKLLLLFVLSF